MNLAGSAAEAIVFGAPADGANGDHQKWLTAATHFLTSGLSEVFYADCAAESHIEHNDLWRNSPRMTTPLAGMSSLLITHLVPTLTSS